MGNANIPDDWMGDYKDFVVRWPASDQWEAILRGQLTAPDFEDFWDLFSGDPEASMIAMDETLDTNLHLEEGAMLPAGMIIDFAGSVIPDGWEICDFGELNRVTFARLYAVVGTIYGPGDGTTTFNKPPASGRVNVALDTTDADFNALGEFRGSKSVILEISEMPAHTHLQNAHTHTQTAHNHTQSAHSHQPTINSAQVRSGATSGSGVNNVNNDNGNSIGGTQWLTNNAQPTIQDTTATNQNTTATNQNEGGDEAHNNIQPSIVFYRLIKT